MLRFKDFLSSCVLVALIASAPETAHAGGWDTVHRYVHRTGKCGAAKEVLASQYSIGTTTASGEPMSRHSLTAASHEYPLGTTVAVTNPVNGRTCSIRVNDRGPYGKSREVGVKIDFAVGAARCLGMHGTQYVCLPNDAPTEVAGVPRIVDGNTIEIGATKIRLHGSDAPETDQICLDADADRWTCGIAARDELIKRSGGKIWSCNLVGEDKYGRAQGKCSVNGVDIGQWMVRHGWALSSVRVEPDYDQEQAEARAERAGLWAGAFVAPRDWRGRNKQTEILGAPDVRVSARDVLLSAASAAEPPAPECRIKGHLNGPDKCVYHLPGGRGYDKLKIDLSKSKRWFCATEEAKAAGCRAFKG